MIGDFGFRISDFGFEGRQCCSARSIRNPQSAFHNGVTLIELLITITIISILSAAFLGTSNLAMESSRKARTKTTIGKIHGLLMEKWSEYATRRVDIQPQLLADLETEISRNIPPNLRPRALGEGRADMRLLATRELMKLEMPDRWSDILGTGVAVAPPTGPVANFRTPEVLLARPALTSTYLRRYRSLPGTDLDQLVANQGAECLYLIVMLATADGEARTLFSEQDIGDTDEDGAPEFLDGWGQPISYIRWPTGFVLQSDLMSGDPDLDHDPIDVFRRDQAGVTSPSHPLYPDPVDDILGAMRGRSNRGEMISAFRLVPLVYSVGPDGLSGILTSRDTTVGLDPYLAMLPALDYPSGYIGSPVINDNGEQTTEHLDNIHSHLQDNK